MDRTKAKMIQKYLSDMFEDMEREIKETLGVKLSVGNASFGSDNTTIKLEASDIGDDGVVKSKDTTDFNNYASMFGLKRDDLGKTFKFRSKTYTIKGLKPRSKKYPVVVEGDNGKPYKMPVDMVLEGLGR